MKILPMFSFAFRTAAGILSLGVSAYGVHSFGWVDMRQDTLITGLFCILPVLSFPVFLLAFRWPFWSAAIHWLLAAGYLVIYSMLDWRTCAELGYCNGVSATVLQTLTARPVEACFAVAVLNLAAVLSRGMRRPARDAAFANQSDR
jgi:hypothetical protein